MCFGFSINTLTLFGLVLAVGLLVDDAIVVVENVERILEEQPELSVPRDATIQSMGQIQMALIAIALVLSAVFLPMAFFGGSTGVIYRQFSATIVSAMVLSVLLALTFSPSLAADLAQAQAQETSRARGSANACPALGASIETARTKFNNGFRRLIEWFVASVEWVVDRKWLFLAIYAGIVVLLVVLFVRLPTGFIPTEDQGAIGPVPASRGRDLRSNAARSSTRSRIISSKARRRRTSVPISPSRAAARARAARMSARPSSTSPISASAPAARTAPTRSSSARPPPSTASATRRCSRWSRRRSAASAGPRASRWSFRTAAA